MNQSTIEKMKVEILAKIKNELKTAWNNARKLEVEQELVPFKIQYANEKEPSKQSKKNKIETDRLKKIVDAENEYKNEYAALEALRTENKQNLYNKYSEQYIFNSQQKLLSNKNKKIDDINRYAKWDADDVDADVEKEYETKCTKKEKELCNKYEQIFLNKWTSEYILQFSTQFNNFKINELHTKLLARHPWLQQEISTDESTNLIYVCLKEVIEKSFWMCLIKDPSISAWNKLDLQHNRLNWTQINDTWLTQFIQSYHLRSFTNYRVHTFPMAWYTSDLIGARLTRHDLLNFSQYQNHFDPIPCTGEIFCIKTLPVHISELTTFSREEINTIEFLFVNINTEDLPIWVLLHKNNGVKTLYLPKNLSLPVTFNESLLVGFSPITKVVEVDLTKHSEINEENASKLAIWHAALITRVYSWCRQPTDTRPPLDNYRNSLPALILIEKALNSTVSSGVHSGLNRPFANRFPYSNYDLIEYCSNSLLNKDNTTVPSTEHLFSDWKVLPNNFDIDKILVKFDNKSLQISKSKESITSPDTLTISAAESQTLLYAIKLSEHHKFSRLVISNPALDSNSISGDQRSLGYQLITTNLTITTVFPVNNTKLSSHKYLYQCAARNRFINVMEPGCLNNPTSDSGAQLLRRKKIWDRTSKLILDLFKQRFSFDEIHAVINFNRVWRTAYCSNESRTAVNDKIWSFVQLAQMGSKGLDEFFSKLKNNFVNTWDDTYKEKAPNLNCVFDLQGSLVETPLEYINTLKDKIATFGDSKECAPLFKNLSLVLPELAQDEKQNINYYKAIRELILALHARRKKYPDELCEVELYNFDINNKLSDELLVLLQKDAEDPNIRLQISIKIPDWDRETFVNNRNLGSRKAKYKNLQNHVENNLRFARYASLKANTQAFFDYKNGVINPEVELANRDAQLSQIWGGEDVDYPLTAESPGIQQQLQQQISRENNFEKSKKLEAVKEKEVIRQISQYGGNEVELITRANIEERCRADWNKLPEKTRKMSGISSTDTLDKFFSLVVGSDNNSSFVIEKIHPVAMKKIMDFAAYFKDGIDYVRTPGFEVKYSSGGKYVLTFDDHKEKQDLMAQKDLIARNKRDAFARQLKMSKIADVVRGDYRQFSTFVENSGDYANPNEASQQNLQTYWTHLATDDLQDPSVNTNFLTAANSLIVGQKTNDEARAILALHNVIGNNIKAPFDLTKQIEIIRVWAKKENIPEITNSFLSLLLNDLTKDNIKALGQIFNQFDTTDKVYKYTISLPLTSLLYPKKEESRTESVISGTKRFLRLAAEVYSVFVEENFKIWKNRLLIVREDWSEILDKEEVTALVASMSTLKDNNDYQNIFWKLVDTHGNAVGPMRLTEVWYGFAKILKFVETNRLTINCEALLTHLNNKMRDGKFNATNFLYRLNFVLNHVAEKSDSQLVQQEILDNIDKIDWRYNGFYYACRYGQYRFADESIGLTNLNSLYDGRVSDVYEVPWDTISLNKINDLAGYALRYAAQRMGLHKKDFNELSKKISKNINIFQNNNVNSPEAMRLLLASLAIGIDSINELGPKEFKSLSDLMKLNNTSIVSKINQLIKLDNQDLKKNTLQMRLVDLPIFIEVFASHNLDLDLDLINICGHALHCFDRQGKNDAAKKQSLNKLLRFVRSLQPYPAMAFVKSLISTTDKPGYSNPLVAIYPWIIDEVVENNGVFNFNEPFSRYRIYSDSLNTFKKQLNSINPKNTTWFPNYQEISKAINDIYVNGHEKRKEIVNAWKIKGCDITDQNANYRSLNDHEAEAVKQHRDLRLSVAYERSNSSLFKELVPYLAVRVDSRTTANIDEQVTPLLDLFSKFDGKTEYDELSKILGLLLDKSQDSKTGVRRYYSIEQLTLWLKTFFNETEFAKKPYPTRFLEELLNDALMDPKSSLLNSDLEHLRSTDDSSLKLQNLMNIIIASGLSFSSQELLVKLSVKLKKDARIIDYIHHIKTALNNINSDEREKYFSTLVMDPDNIKNLSAVLKILLPLTESPKYAQDNQALVELFKNNQAKLLEMLAKDNIKLFPKDNKDTDHVGSYITKNSNEKEYYINLIIVAALENPRNAAFEKIISDKLISWSAQEIQKLALYYTELPRPTIVQLAELLAESNNTKQLIHKFETVVQATNPDKSSKRIYSISAEDVNDIKRVLDGFKLKGVGFISDEEQKDLLNLLYYTNSYSKIEHLSDLQFEDLQAKLYSELAISRDEHDPQAVARVLACMREILLRKTGMWANHTQMIDLLYGALHNNESLLHQVKTGEGKSIITLMRTSYRALNGQIVDVFSSKDSLSKRDHAEFKMVFNAFGIRNSYINASSSHELYHSELDRRGIGAVNYCTIGNWSLFVSGVFWQNLKNFNLKAKNRVAFIDEGDHVLRDEHTQFNYSDNGDGKSVYNYDEWVYREAYEFYLEHKESFKGYFDGNPSVSRNKEIKDLCEQLQRVEQNVAPKQSKFFREFIIPAIQQPNAENFEARDQQLRQLLTAAHVASGLIEDKHFCVMSETRIVSEGVGIDTNFAKVVINNQVYHGSTYSELVQQFLHVRLNHEAVQKKQTPKFFVEPDTEIALSLNAPYIIKNYYAYAEACTGTSGDKDDLSVYAKEFNIHRVIKLPTHAEIKTEFFAPIYAHTKQSGNQAPNDYVQEGRNIQAEEIVKSILANNAQPMLITCEDDNSVRELGKIIKSKLQDINLINNLVVQIRNEWYTDLKNQKTSQEQYRKAISQLDDYVNKFIEKDCVLDTNLEDTHGMKNSKFILDTNANRRSEADILPFAGRKGSITISSRMGRGTDIKPYDKTVGLRVIRTYPIHPRVAKQEQGRQGRNGANGACQDILNYNEIYLDHLQYSDTNSYYREKFEKHYNFEAQHLEQKLKKHVKLNKTNKKIWAHIAINAGDKEKYLITRTLQRLKLEINREVNKFIRRKEDLQSILCGEIISVLPKLSESDRDNFKVAWRKARRKINAAWNRRLANKQGGDTEEVYKEFFISVYQIWQGFACQYDVLDPYLLSSMLEQYGAEVQSKITDNTVHGANVRQIEEIEKKWLNRSPDNPVTSADCDAIKKDRTKVKRMTLQYHPDKCKLDILQLTAEKANAYFQVVKELLDELTQIEGNAENVAPIQTSSQQPTSTLNNNPHVVNHEKQQRQDMPAVISFYQAWFEGINKNIVDLKNPELDRDIYNELFGEKASKVNHLFKIVDLASKHDKNLKCSSNNIDGLEENRLDGAEFKISEDEMEISIENQTERRRKLFTTLTKLFKDYQSCYVISADAWAKIIEDITKNTDKHILENYPAWLDTFFKALGDKKPINLKSKEEVYRISRIFNMMFKIYGTVFIPKEGEKEVSKEFTEDMVELLLNRYASEFDESLIEQIEKFFTQDKEVGELLLRQSNRADIINMLDVVAKHKNSTTLDDNFRKFTDYVKKELNSLQSNPACIRSVFDLLVNVIKQENVYVPSFESLSKPIFEQKSEAKTSQSKNNLKTQAVFLSFLSQRPGYSEDSYNNLLKIINKKDSNKIIASLAKLPPYISIDFIAKHLSPVPGKHDIGQYEVKINSIKNASQSFNEFLYKRGIIASVDNFDNPLEQEDYVAWTNYLSKSLLAKSQSFFSITKDIFATNNEVMLQVANDYSASTIANDNSLREVVAVLQEAQELPSLQKNLYLIFKKVNMDAKAQVDLINYAKLVKSIPSQYLSLFEKQLSEIANMSLEEIKRKLPATIYFAKVFSDKKFTGFNAEDLSLLNDLWISKFDTVWLNKHIEISESLVKYESRTSKHPAFHKKYKENINNETILDKLCQGLKIFNEVKDMPGNPVNDVFINAYFSVRTPITSEALQQALNIYQCLSSDKYKVIPIIMASFIHEMSLSTVQETLNQFSTFINVTYKEPLDLQVITNLFKYFRGKSTEDMEKAIKTFKLAQNLNKDNSLFNQYFSSLDNGLEERIELMRFVHHGVLDFLGADFKKSCIDKHKCLFAASTADKPNDAKSDRVSFKARLYKWCLNISKIMYETIEIMRLGSIGNATIYNSNKSHIRNYNQSSCDEYQTYYKSFWFSTNKTRKAQASKLFGALRSIDYTTNDVNRFYLKTIQEIHKAQDTIVSEDIRRNSNRWFTNINRKGYSRLFDITTEIKSKVLQSYHDLVLSGNISPDEYKLVQTELKKQVYPNVVNLINALPEKNKLRDSLLSAIKASKSQVNNKPVDVEYLITSLKQITTLNETNAPKHVQHLVEDLITNLQLTDTNSLPKKAICAM